MLQTATVPLLNMIYWAHLIPKQILHVVCQAQFELCYEFFQITSITLLFLTLHTQAIPPKRAKQVSPFAKSQDSASPVPTPHSPTLCPQSSQQPVVPQTNNDNSSSAGN